MELLSAFPHPDAVRQLFAEYTALLAEGEPSFRAYLAMQDFEEECRHLEGKYGPPAGRLYLAREGGDWAGCVGLRPIGGGCCEMKRLYVRPRFRGRRLGRQLAEQVIRDAEEAGYQAMLLDTFPFLTGALALYRQLGFHEVERYNDNPIPRSVYLRLDLPRQ